MGNLINKILFQPPNPPTPFGKYSDKIVYLKCPQDKGNQVKPVKIPVLFLGCDKSPVCLLYSHGNGVDLGKICVIMELFRNAFQINVCCYDYQGYGKSKPKVGPTEIRCYSSIVTVMKFLTKKKNFHVSNIVLFGRSMGSGPSCYVSCKCSNIKGLILQSAFLSVIKTKVKFAGLERSFGDMFENYKLIKKIKCPVFVIHGMRDGIVPFDHGKEIYQRSKNKYPPLFVSRGNHSNIMRVYGVEEYLTCIYGFLLHIRKKDSKEPVLDITDLRGAIDEFNKTVSGDMEEEIPLTMDEYNKMYDEQIEKIAEDAKNDDGTSKGKYLYEEGEKFEINEDEGLFAANRFWRESKFKDDFYSKYSSDEEEGEGEYEGEGECEDDNDDEEEVEEEGEDDKRRPRSQSKFLKDQKKKEKEKD